MFKDALFATGAALLLTAAPAAAQDDWYPLKFGKDDEAGHSNLMTPERVKDAVDLIKEGKVISLAREHSDKMPLFGHRIWATRDTNGLSGGPLDYNKVG
jgi:hypothetical protein